MMDAQRKESPSVAFGLALAGGILIMIAGIVVMVIGALVTIFIAGVGGVFGLIGVIWGILIIVFAFLLRSTPERHVGYGVTIIILAFLSWFGAFGGFVLGFLLALIGGIMAIVWNPGEVSVNVTVGSGGFQGGIPPPPQPSASTRFCPNCGAQVEAGAQFCRGCGRPLR
jgi:hypothetical protein